MESKELLKKGTIVCGSILVIGVIMFLTNMKNLEDCILFGDLVSDMRRAYIISGISWSDTVENAYASAVKSGNFAFTGIIISIVSIVSWIIVYFSYLKKANTEAIREQSLIIKDKNKRASNDNVIRRNNDDKKEELLRMKNSGFITEEEYEEMKAKL